MRRVLTLALMIVILASGLAEAQMKTSAEKVTVKAVPGAVTAAPGERVAFEVKMDVEKKWHVYAHEDTNSIGIDLFTAEDFLLADLQIEYPEGHKGEFYGMETIELDGKQVMKASALVPDDLAAGDYDLELALTVQVCDDKTCLQPADLPIKLKLKVE